jgi:outer membrane protein, heavy metal efflux system
LGDEHRRADFRVVLGRVISGLLPAFLRGRFAISSRPSCSMSPFKLSHLSIACALALVPSVVSAETAPPAPLTLSAALAAALEKSPVLKAHSFASRIAEARILQAGVKPNPTLSVGLENMFGTGALSGVKGLETTVQLSQVIDLGGSLPRRIETATAERAIADTDYEIRRIEVFGEVARRFTEAAADAARLTSARSAREVAAQTVAAVESRVAAAKASPLELNKARTALALLGIEEEHAEHELATCRQSLAAALGEAEPTFGDISADLLTLPAAPEFSSLAARLEASPVLARYTVEARWHEAQIRLSQSLRRSGLTLSGGLRRVEATDGFGFVAGVSMPLPVRDQTSGAVREARERRAQTDASADAARLELRATLFAVYQEMLHARTALTALREKILPDAEHSLVLAREGYAAGRHSLLEVLDAQKSLIELRAAVVANAAAYHLHVIEIERLLGAPLTPVASS